MAILTEQKSGDPNTPLTVPAAIPAAPPPAAAAPAPDRPPLWRKPIPVLGVTGEYGAGKTIFLATIAPGPETLIFDTEKSSASYAGDLGFTRVDVPAEMLKTCPGGYRPIDTYTWWVSLIKHIPPGKFRVIAVDVAEEIEAGLSDWVWENPLHFNRTKAQYLKMAGLYWGDVKALWKMLLADLASRCETFAFSVHMGSIWANEKPTDKRKPKGKLVLMELASLYLQLDRPKDDAGNVQARPSAVVIKNRLTHITMIQGVPNIIPALPPRLPIATPEHVRAYLQSPPDYAHLRPEERAPEKPMTEDERTDRRTAAANAESEAERLKIERMQMEAKKAAAGNGQDDNKVTHTLHVQVTKEAAPEAATKTPEGAAPSHGNLPASAPTGTTSGNGTLESPTAPEAFAGPVVEPSATTTVVNGVPMVDTPETPPLPAHAWTPDELFTELATLKALPEAAAADMRGALARRYGKGTLADLSPYEVTQAQDLLVERIRKHYADLGRPQECPF